LLTAGVLTGLAVLCRESAVLLLVAIGVLVWPARRAGLGHAARLAVVVACCVAVVAPWTVRNAVRLHAFVPVSTSLGMGIQGSYNDSAAHDRSNPTLWVPSFYDPATARLLTRRPMDEVAVDSLLRHETIKYVEAHPTYPAHVALWNFVRLYDLRGGSDAHYTGRYMPWDQGLVSAAVVSYFVVLALAVVGAFTRRARTVPVGVWLVPVLLTAVLIVVAGNTRYRAPIEPFLVLLAAAAIAAALDRLRGRPSGDGHDRVAERNRHPREDMALARHDAGQTPIQTRRDPV
jgi:4-amino-4-deoxy-L-arabinose transferase-like glycosyltransferase